MSDNLTWFRVVTTASHQSYLSGVITAGDFRDYYTFSSKSFIQSCIKYELEFNIYPLGVEEGE